MKETILKLVKKAQQNDEQAFAMLYQETFEDAFKIAMRLCKNKQDAFDAVQDSYMQMQSSLPHLRNPESFYLWMSRIVVSKCTRIFRNNHSYPMSHEQLDFLHRTEHRKEFVPELQMDEETECTLMHMFTEELSPKLREVVELVYYEQYSIEEVSQILQIPEGTIKSRLHNARKELKEKIAKFEGREGRKVHFYDAMASGILTTFASIKTFVKQQALSHATVISVVNTTVMVASGVSLSVVVAYGGTQVIQEATQAHTANSPQQEAMSVKQDLQISNTSFHAEYNHESFDSPKQAYYEIIQWGKDPQLVKDTKSTDEIKSIASLYVAIKDAQGPYWDLLQSEGWIEIFE